MDIHLQVITDEDVITPISDFTFSWCISHGLNMDDSTRFTIALSELISNIILFANPHTAYTDINLTFRNSKDNIEIIISECGEPFDPDRHRYNSERAMLTGNFEGAGLRIVRKFSDDFLFVNKGKEGKEFRISKNLEVHDIDELLERSRSVSPDLVDTPDSPAKEIHDFTYSQVKVGDAEDIAKLIYRAYEYSYSKEELYYPKKIEEAVLGKEKLGVICRDENGNAVGYFAVLKKEDSNIAEAGEAVVSQDFRRLGIMNRMMEYLIDISRENNLTALFGKAVTIHPVSQRVNYKFNFKTTALMLGETKSIVYMGFDEDYPQPISVIIDFLPLAPVQEKSIYVPDPYKDILMDTYRILDWPVRELSKENPEMDNQSDIQLEIDYAESTALLTIHKYGSDFREVLSEMLESLQKQEELNVVYADLPLENPATPLELINFQELGFIYCGLAPMFHKNMDYLRLQKLYIPLNLDLFEIYSEFGNKIKSFIADEYSKIA